MCTVSINIDDNMVRSINSGGFYKGKVVEALANGFNAKWMN